MTSGPGPTGADQPDLALLSDWLEGRLDRAAAARVAAAVEQGDAALQDSVAWLREFITISQADAAAVPPPLVRQRLRQHFSRWLAERSGAEPQPGVSAQATLVFDSRVDRPRAAVRGGRDTETVHLAYHSGLADLVVDVRLLGHGYARLQGQVLPATDTGAPIFEVVAAAPTVTLRVVDGDELGRFTITPVPIDRYDLTLSNGEITLTAALDLRSA